VTAHGFRGGQVHNQSDTPGVTEVTTTRTTDPTQGGEKGESIAGSDAVYQAGAGQYGRGAPANGGGGGNAHASGGGGGGGGGDPTKWNGQGVMDSTVTGGVMAWALDPGYINNGDTYTSSTGGGRGGYSYSRPMTGVTPNPTVNGPGLAMWGGDDRQPVGGIGGRPLTPNPGFQIYMGGGGGAGDEANNSGGNGGNGGGVVLLMTDSLTVPGPMTGFIRANGGDGADTTNGNNDAAGGGGGGGSIFIFSNQTLASDVQLIANGGYGGSQSRAPSDVSEADGPAGGGGGGFIAHTTTGTPTATALGQIGGDTVGTTMVGFPNNGATNGNVGTVMSAPRQPTIAGMPSYYPICLPADLQVTITPSSGQVQPGSTATFTVVIMNSGANPAPGSNINTTLPAGVAANQITWTCAAAGGTTCAMNSGSGALPTQADFPVSGSLTFVMTVTAPMMSPSPSLTLTVSAQPPPGFTDPTPLNNTATAMIPIAGVMVQQPSADLQVTVNSSPSMPAAGTSTTLTIIAANNGPDAAPEPVVVFTLPLGSMVTTPPPAPGTPGNPWGCVAMGTTYACTLTQSLPAKMSAMPIMVVFTTPTSGSGSGTPQVAVVVGSQGSTDPNPANNIAVLNLGAVQPAGVADLALAITKSPTNAGPGQATTFTLQVTNLGPATAVNPEVTFSVPGGSQITQWPAGTGWSCTENSDAFICLASAIAPGAAPPIAVTVIAPLPANMTQDPGAVAGVVSSPSTIDPNPANNTASQPIAANPTPTGSDLSIQITVDKPNPLPGDSVTYTAIATNSGPDTVNDPYVVLNLPPGVTVSQPAGGMGWTCSQLGNTALCTYPSLPEGSAPPITAIVTYPSTGSTGLTPGTVVVGAPANNDPNPSNNVGIIDPRPPLPASSADLALTITKSPATSGAGMVITYTLQATNNGPGSVSDPSVTFTIPEGSTLVQAPSGTGWSCIQSGYSFTCFLSSTLQVGPAAPITVQVNTPVPTMSQDPGAVAGDVSSPSNSDPMPLNNIASAPVANTPPTGSDLSIQITQTPVSANIGDTVTYTANVSNAGPATVNDPVVAIDLPPGSQVMSGPTGDGWSCVVDSNQVLCTRPSVPSGAAPPITVQAWIPPYTTTQPLSPAQAVVSAADNNDPNLGNNVANSQLFRFAGGGFACSEAGQSPGASASLGWLLFATLALLGLRSRRRALSFH
jgi:uncharacterized repeat protein (TIGR01451 family)